MSEPGDFLFIQPAARGEEPEGHGTGLGHRRLQRPECVRERGALRSGGGCGEHLGHDAGDRLLGEVATRLKRCLREEDTVARLGGDDFVVLIEGYKEPADLALVAGKIVTALGRPFLLAGHEAPVSASIGISTYPADARDAYTLPKHADAAILASPSSRVPLKYPG